MRVWQAWTVFIALPFALVALWSTVGQGASASAGTVSHSCDESSAAVAGETVTGVVEVPGSGSVWFGVELEPHRSISLWLAVEEGADALPDPILVGYRNVGDSGTGGTFGVHAEIDGRRWYPLWSARRTVVCVEVASRAQNGSGSFSVVVEVETDEGLGGGSDGYSADIPAGTDTTDAVTAGQQTQYGEGPTHKSGFLGDGGPGDEDWFRVDLDGGFDYRISVIPDPDAPAVDRLADPVIVGIFDSGGNAVTAGLSWASGPRSPVNFRPSVDGEYFVAVGSGTGGRGSFVVCVDRVGWVSVCNPPSGHEATSEPGPVSGLKLVPGVRQILATWAAAADQTGGEADFYEVEWKTASQAWEEARRTYIDVTRYTIAGLVSGIVHNVRVTGFNTAGHGPSAEGRATPEGSPDPPAGVTAEASDKSVALSWTAPGSDGGSPVTKYQYRYSDDNGVTWDPDWDDVSDSDSDNDLSDELALTVADLTNGTAYTFQVRAVNVRGPSQPAQVVATPATVPEPPTGVTAEASDGSVALSWTAPGSDGGSPVTKYQYRYSDDNGVTWDPDWDDVSDSDSDNDLSDELALTVADLTNGTAYTFQVRAVNVRGPSQPAQVVATPATVPEPPTGVTAEASDGSVALSWTAPGSDGGSPVTKYQYRYSDDNGVTWDPDWDDVSDSDSDNDLSDELALTVADLTNGTAYTFQVRAVNVRGPSQPAQVVATPATVPEPPTGVTAEASDGSVALSWTAPGSDGGSPVTKYQYRYSDDNGVTWDPDWDDVSDSDSDNDLSDELALTVADLTNGTAYTFQVRAVNVRGPSQPAQVVATPATVPEPPTGVTAEASDKSVALTWTAPDSDGGSPVTKYQYRQGPAGSKWWSAWEAVPDGEDTGTSTGDETGYTVTGLINGTKVRLEVRAVNAMGESDESSQGTATPKGPPEEPSSMMTTPGDKKLGVSWAEPGIDGGSDVTGYRIEWKQSTQTWDQASSNNPAASARAYDITGLTNGTTYDVRLAAKNAKGTGPYLELSAAPTNTAGTPQDLTVAGARHDHLTVRWKAPVGAADLTITHYLLEWRASSEPYNAAKQRTVESGFHEIGKDPNPLRNEITYYVRVTTKNGTTSLGSAEATAVTLSAERHTEANIVQEYETEYPWLRQAFSSYPVEIVLISTRGILGQYERLIGLLDGWERTVNKGRRITLRWRVYLGAKVPVHEYAHHFTLDPRVPNNLLPVGVGWLYFHQASEKPGGGYCPVHEVYADMLTYVTLGATNIRSTQPDFNYLIECRPILNVHPIFERSQPTTESQTVATSIAKGETPQWFNTNYALSDNTLDLDSIWSDIRETTAESQVSYNDPAYYFRGFAGGYCSSAEANWALEQWTSNGEHPGYNNPWVDGGCTSRQPQNLTLAAGDTSITVTWQAPLYASSPTVDQYLVQWRLETEDYSDTNKAIVSATSALSHTISSLTNGKKYFVRVAAVATSAPSNLEDDDGRSRVAEASATPTAGP